MRRSKTKRSTQVCASSICARVSVVVENKKVQDLKRIVGIEYRGVGGKSIPVAKACLRVVGVIVERGRVDPD